MSEMRYLLGRRLIGMGRVCSERALLSICLSVCQSLNTSLGHLRLCVAFYGEEVTDVSLLCWGG